MITKVDEFIINSPNLYSESDKIHTLQWSSTFLKQPMSRMEQEDPD